MEETKQNIVKGLKFISVVLYLEDWCGTLKNKIPIKQIALLL